jgi:hypothetical protein
VVILEAIAASCPASQIRLPFPEYAVSASFSPSNHSIRAVVRLGLPLRLCILSWQGYAAVSDGKVKGDPSLVRFPLKINLDKCAVNRLSSINNANFPSQKKTTGRSA